MLTRRQMRAHELGQTGTPQAVVSSDTVGRTTDPGPPPCHHHPAPVPKSARFWPAEQTHLLLRFGQTPQIKGCRPPRGPLARAKHIRPEFQILNARSVVVSDSRRHVPA